MKTLMALILISFSACVMAGPSTKTIYFLGTNDFKVVNDSYAGTAGYELKQYNMDGHLNLEQHLSEGLPQDDIELAEKIANERLENMDWSILQKAFQGLALASAWDVRKLPAFVFADGKFVIYGVTDTQEAIKRWEQYRSRDHYSATKYR